MIALKINVGMNNAWKHCPVRSERPDTVYMRLKNQKIDAHPKPTVLGYRFIRDSISMMTFYTIIEINYSRLMMPLALSRGILLTPRSERVVTQLSLFVSMEAYGSVYVLTKCSTASGEYLTIFAVWRR